MDRKEGTKNYLAEQSREAREWFPYKLLHTEIEFFQKMKLFKEYLLGLEIEEEDRGSYNYFIDVQNIRIGIRTRDYQNILVHLEDLLWKGGGSPCCLKNRVALLTVLDEILSLEGK